MADSKRRNLKYFDSEAAASAAQRLAADCADEMTRKQEACQSDS